MEVEQLRPKIVICEPQGFSPTALEILQQAADVTVPDCWHQVLYGDLCEFDAVWGGLRSVIAAQMVARAVVTQGVRCKFIATPTTGLDHIDLKACEYAGIRVLSLRGETEFLKEVRGTAELTVGLMLALLRNLPEAFGRVGAWTREKFVGRELYGKTVAIIGYGRLGKLVDRYLHAFGAKTIAIDRDGSLLSALPHADIVSLHVSYDESTRHLMNRETFAAMKPGALLINTSRGGVVDEAALIEALESGHLAGAALDVLEGEPWVVLPPIVQYASKHSNVILTPHMGGNTFESREKTDVFLARKLVEALHESREADAVLSARRDSAAALD